jgi:hypothetical protein
MSIQSLHGFREWQIAAGRRERDNQIGIRDWVNTLFWQEAQNTICRTTARQLESPPLLRLSSLFTSS